MRFEPAETPYKREDDTREDFARDDLRILAMACRRLRSGRVQVALFCGRILGESVRGCVEDQPQPVRLVGRRRINPGVLGLVFDTAAVRSRGSI